MEDVKRSDNFRIWFGIFRPLFRLFAAFSLPNPVVKIYSKIFRAIKFYTLLDKISESPSLYSAHTYRVFECQFYALKEIDIKN